MYADLDNNPGTSVDDRYFLRIRLIDLLVGDWDRHSGQWRWARVGNQWRAIPEDRDWAFARMDGFVGGLARLFVPKYVGFSDEFPAVKRLAEQADRIDHRVLSRLNVEDFLAVAHEVQSALTDSVIDAAVGALPQAYLQVERERLVSALTSRRDRLVEYTGEYYHHVMKQVRVYGFNHSADIVEFDQVTDSSARIRLRSGSRNGPVRFERIINARETREVKLFIEGGKDQIVGDSDLPFKVSMGEQSQPDKEDD
jgi:hypothetical protein